MTMSRRPRLLSTPHDALSRWLGELRENPHREDDWSLYETGDFADLWYGARLAGESLRAHALRRLYRQRAHPGGPFPDPRERGAFSSRAVLGEAAHHLGIAIRYLPGDLMHRMQRTKPRSRPSLAGILTYPGGRRPEIVMQYDAEEATLHFEMACLMGYLSKERQRLLDPYAPAGLTLPPQDPSLVTVLHQFAIGLLCLQPQCPKHWTCDCNAIRLRFNVPPDDHAEQTDASDLRDLHAEILRHHTDPGA